MTASRRPEPLPAALRRRQEIAQFANSTDGFLAFDGIFLLRRHGGVAISIREARIHRQSQ